MFPKYASFNFSFIFKAGLLLWLWPIATKFWVPPYASLPSSDPRCGRSSLSPHSHIHLRSDWNKTKLLSGPRPPCNWILPCFTECNKALYRVEGKYTEHLERNLGHDCPKTERQGIAWYYSQAMLPSQKNAEGSICVNVFRASGAFLHPFI